MYACMSVNVYAAHIFDVTEKNHCHIANMTTTAIILNVHINPTFLHMCVKTQSNAIPTSLAIAMHGSATNMLLNMPHTQISSCTHMT